MQSEIKDEKILEYVMNNDNMGSFKQFAKEKIPYIRRNKLD